MNRQERRHPPVKCGDLKIERPFLSANPPSMYEVPTYCQRVKGHEGDHLYFDHNWVPVVLP